VSHVEKVRTLEGVIAEHDPIKREIGALRELVEKGAATKSSGDHVDTQNREQEREEEFGGVSAEVDDDDSRSIWTIVPHELERVEEDEDEKQMVKLEEEKERRTRGVGTRKTEDPRAYELSDVSLIPGRQSTFALPEAAIGYRRFQRLTMLLNQLESAVELSSTLQPQHSAAQNTISVLESRVMKVPARPLFRQPNNVT
jgi:hypothetical protein